MTDISAKAESSEEARALSNKFDRLASRIDHCIQQGNDWLERQACSEFENYVDGHLNFALEFVCACHDGAEFRLGKIVAKAPRAEAGVEKRNVVKAVWKIGDKLSDHCGQTSCVITYGYKQPMLVENVKFVDEIKHLVAARFSIGLKPLQRVAEFCPNMLGHSLFNFTVKVCCFCGERELDAPCFSVQRGRPSSIPDSSRNSLPVVHDFPKRMIEGGPKIVNGIADDQSHCGRDGLILFGVSGTFAGVCIRFNDVTERSRFTEEFVKSVDVIRGPVNLEQCAVCHAALQMEYHP
jgi:hypothetical protein